jgi:hypothetical protein
MFEAKLMEKFTRLDNWNDTAVYKNERGEMIPETLYFMMAIKGYYNERELDEIKKVGGGEGSSKNKPRHAAADYEREF